MKSLNRISLFLSILIGFASPLWSFCGDVNGDGLFNVGDDVYLLTYLIKGGSGPYDYLEADFDGYDRVTFNDFVCALRSGVQPDCPPSRPRISGPINNGFRVSLDKDTWPAGDDNIFVQVRVNSQWQFILFTLPLVFDVGGESPTIDLGLLSIDPDFADWADGTVYRGTSGPGQILFCGADTGHAPIGPFTADAYPDGKTLAIVNLSLPSAPSTDQPLTVSWDDNCLPIDPVYGRSHEPLVILQWNRGDYVAYTPVINEVAIPSLTFWGIIALILLIAISGIYIILRRRTVSNTG